MKNLEFSPCGWSKAWEEEKVRELATSDFSEVME
jgi:hypothetical protein